MTLKVGFIFFALVLVICMGIVRADDSYKMDYPDNFRHSRELKLEDEHFRTPLQGDKNIFDFFFRDKTFKERTHPEIYPPYPEKIEFKNKRTFWEIVKDRIKGENVFDFSVLTDRLTTPQRILTAVSLGLLLDNDRQIYKEMDEGMKKSKFWKNKGEILTYLGDGFTEAGLSALFYIHGSKKSRQVSQMLMESALSMRVVYIKRIIGLTRPSELIANMGPDLVYDSFPSGHTYTAFSMATILGEAYNIKWITYPLAFLSGLSRIQQNTHWPSDILAGAVLGNLEGRQILADHGYIPSTKIAESHLWDNTRMGIQGNMRLFYDDNPTLVKKGKFTDRVGRMSLLWRLEHKISPWILAQVNYHWRGQIPSIVNYNSAEDMLINPRLAIQLNPRWVLLAGFTYNKLEFNDLATASHCPERGKVPDNLDYVGAFKEKTTSVGLMYRLNDETYIKPFYDFSIYRYGKYHHLNSQGRNYSLEMACNPEKKKFGYNLGISVGNEKCENSRYSFNNFQVRAEGNYKLSDKGTLTASYLREERKYPHWQNGIPKARWQTIGVEFSHRFCSTWDAQLAYYRKNLSSNISGWDYNKNQYSLNVNRKF